MFIKTNVAEKRTVNHYHIFGYIWIEFFQTKKKKKRTSSFMRTLDGRLES